MLQHNPIFIVNVIFLGLTGIIFGSLVMHMGMSTQKIIPSEPRERSLWVLGQLRLRGESFASIGLKHGKSRYAARMAMFQPSAEMEKALADALDLKPRELFPERYDARGRRLHQVREPKAQRSAAA